MIDSVQFGAVGRRSDIMALYGANSQEGRVGRQQGQTQGQGATAVAPSNFKGFSQKINDFFDGAYNSLPQGFRQHAGAGSTAEVSVRANVSSRFESSYNYSGPNGEKISAYTSMTRETSLSADFRMAQANDIANAQMNATEGFGPEATAGRIVDFAMSFFPMFASQNSDMSYEDQVTAYEKMVTDAIDKGFSEAMAILGDLPDEVSSGINETRDLISAQLSEIFDMMRGDGAEEAQKSLENGSFKDFLKADKAVA